jgi:uncharacterized membrane protein YdjX (TVP38/TMEM64 family)
VSHYFLAIAVITGANLLPAFAPPTWAILVFFTLRYHMNPVGLVLLGVMSATFGRAILANIFRAIRGWLPKGYVANMERIGAKIEDNPRRAFGLLTLFFLSPISSAQLFEAAGIIKRIALGPLLLAFAGGRIISYSIYVSGASVLKETSLGQIIEKEFTSPIAIATQIFLIVGLVALGNVKWNGKNGGG